MSVYAVFSTVLLLAAAICYKGGLSPPNSRAAGFVRVDSGVGRVISNGLASHFDRYDQVRDLPCYFLMKGSNKENPPSYVVVIHMISEIYAFWATTRHQPLKACPMMTDSSTTAARTPYPAHRIPTSAIPPLLLIIFGGLVRMTCHRQLGKMFTWETSIMKNHKLIVNGSYQFVRHPSYTGIMSLCLGYFWFLNVPETFAKECFIGSNILLGNVTTYGNALGVLYELSYFVLYTDACVFLVRRSFAEDGILKQKFGKEWDDWAKRVRWNVLPYVL